MNVLNLQRALKALGEDPGPLDGLYGPLTRSAVDRALTSKDDTSLSLADYAEAAKRLDCDAAVVRAVAHVESGTVGAFDRRTRRPIILFEPHVFSRETDRRFDATRPSVSYVRWGERPYPKSQDARWRQLHEALACDPAAGFRAASWGAFQIMGFNHAACGFDTPWVFARTMSRSQAAQLDGFVTFLIRRELAGMLRERRWRAFAYAYNGPGYARHAYDVRLAAAYARAIARHEAPAS